MTVSNQLQYALKHGFTNNDGTVGIDSRSEKTLVVKKIGGMTFVPSIYIDNILSRIRYTGNLMSGEIVIPLSKPREIVKKTSDSIINSLFKGEIMYGRGHNFNCADTEKGYKYYGGKGLILDNDFKPLLMCGYEVELISVTEGGYKYAYPACIINPDVFEREDMVSKAIVKKVIPYYSTTKHGFMRDAFTVELPESYIKVIVTPEIHNIIQVVTPPLGTDIDDALYNILSENLDEVQRL